MAKTPKLKTNSRSKSAHSRAARREVSPSVNVDKSLTSLPRAERTNTSVPAVLGAQHNSGVSKKGKKPKSRAQRLRQEKGLERAEVVLDKREKKVTKSVRKLSGVKARKVTWDELNKKISHAPEKEKEKGETGDVDIVDTNEMEAEITLPPPKAPSNPVDIPTEQEEQTGLDLDEDIT
ncbi:hypothetical protein McanMca71_005658 [Microsporum canis]|uniref:Ribosome biogenesis protein Alb1 n=1 Tax=Arthroderma otae (strain ATCC MYA-4605 / CBS 113480) TaxID=554155 RepID=C5FMS2_ARTOC|nr:conserved hypothetical protein [Microsporum canis CBS 113480]EEQ31175.1 conserved hypothetical protein [Microsporum canis CBS 113480]